MIVPQHTEIFQNFITGACALHAPIGACVQQNINFCKNDCESLFLTDISILSNEHDPKNRLLPLGAIRPYKGAAGLRARGPAGRRYRPFLCRRPSLLEGRAKEGNYMDRINQELCEEAVHAQRNGADLGMFSHAVHSSRTEYWDFRCNNDIEQQVANALLYRHGDKVIPTTEQKALDALGVAVNRELTRREQEIARLNNALLHARGANERLQQELNSAREHIGRVDGLLRRSEATIMRYGETFSAIGVLLAEGEFSIEELPSMLAEFMLSGEKPSKVLTQRAKDYLSAGDEDTDCEKEVLDNA
jgi:hypothetical protein